MESASSSWFFWNFSKNTLCGTADKDYSNRLEKQLELFIRGQRESYSK